LMRSLPQPWRIKLRINSRRIANRATARKASHLHDADASDRAYAVQ
jgi:hypothetical protein